MREYSITERYILLALSQKTERSFLMSTSIIAGTVLSCLYDLVLSESAQLDNKGHLISKKEPTSQYSYLIPLYQNIQKYPNRNMEKWFEMYCYQIRQKDNKILMQSVIDYMENINDIQSSVRRSFLGKTKISYRANTNCFSEIEKIMEEEIKNVSSPPIDVIVLLALSVASGIERSLYEIIPKEQCKRIISVCKRNSNYKFIKNSIERVQNQWFNYQLSSYNSNV